MNVLQVASSLYDWGGIERYVVYLTEGLRERGHAVEVVCPPGSPLDQKIADGKTLLALRRQFSFRSYLAYRQLFREKRFDVVHVHFSPDFVAPVLAAKKAKAGKVIATRHVALKWSPPKVRRYGALFDHIIPVSNAVEEKLAESGIPYSMMTVAKAGVPALAPEYSPKETNQFTVGSFGRLVKEKGIDVLLKAFANLEDAKLLVYGDGPERQALEAAAGPNVEFKGFVPNVADAMNACDVVAVPSVWDEAFPYSILEAMSIGKPVVASRVGGLPEIVEDGITGRLFDRADDKALAQVLAEMAHDPAQLRKMGESAQALHRNEYTVPRMAERIEHVYQKVLA